MKKAVKMALALLIIAVLTVLIAYATLPYLNYIFGALILFVIFRPLYHFSHKKTKDSEAIRSRTCNNNFYFCCTGSSLLSFEYNHRRNRTAFS